MWIHCRSILAIITVVGIAMRPGPTAAGDKPAPRFEITPKVWFVGDSKLDIRIVNLKPHQKVTVISQTGTKEVLVSRPIEGVADGKGEFDLRGTDKPSPKTGAPFRILWDTKENLTVEPLKERTEIRFRAEVDGKTVATGTLKLNLGTIEDPKVIFKDVKERGLHGVLFLPPGQGPFPGVLLFGGSEGKMSQTMKAAVLAKHGFACLTVAYFDKKGVPGLPQQLVDIPLEYFETAISYLKEHKQVRGDRIAVMGGSRGGEAALLLGSMFPDLKAVVAYAPSHVVWGGWPIADEDRKNKTNRPAWTYKGKPVSYVSRTLSVEEEKRLTENDPFDRRPLFVEYLKDKKMVNDATIQVEKINGPILMITGTDDKLWPAVDMANSVMKRVEVRNHPYFKQSQHLTYEGCGHAIALPLRQAKVLPDQGGSVEGNSFAAWDSWPKVVRFLGDRLK
jgi:dienelactone hydrolase